VEREGREGEGKKGREKEGRVREWRVKTVLPHVKQAVAAYDSSPVCPHQQTTEAKFPFHRSRGGRRTEDFLTIDAALWTLYRCSLTYDFLFCLNFTLHEWRRPSPKTKTETETRGFQLPRPRPRPRLAKMRVSRRLETKPQVSSTPSLGISEC